MELHLMYAFTSLGNTKNIRLVNNIAFPFKRERLKLSQPCLPSGCDYSFMIHINNCTDEIRTFHQRPLTITTNLIKGA